jgi:hypothetical protein
MRNIYIHIHTYIHTYIHIYIYICTNIDRDLETSDLNSFFRVTLTRRSIWPLRSPTSSNSRPLLSRSGLPPAATADLCSRGISIYPYICLYKILRYIYTYMCVCVCVCVRIYLYLNIVYMYMYLYMQGDFDSQKYLSTRSPCSSNSRPLLSRGIYIHTCIYFYVCLSVCLSVHIYVYIYIYIYTYIYI